MENSTIQESPNHQKSKKKAKNKKHHQLQQAPIVVENNGNAATSSSVADIVVKKSKTNKQSTLDNSLSEKLEQSLHITAKKSKSNRCNNKINGVVTIPSPTTATTKNGAIEDTTDINGHSIELQTNYSISSVNGRVSSNEDDRQTSSNRHCNQNANTTNSISNQTDINCHNQELLCETNRKENNQSLSNSCSVNEKSENIQAEAVVIQPAVAIIEKTSIVPTSSAATINTELASVTSPSTDLSKVHIEYKQYESELQMHDIMRLIQAELSEPYSIYTYRYFIYNWPKLCFLAAHGNDYVGAIVCKLDMHQQVRRGYIAMLAVHKDYRNLKIGTTLVQKAIEAMLADNAEEVVLETEMQNMPALRLYENLGFVRDKRLFRYYLNGVDALRLKLWFR